MNLMHMYVDLYSEFYLGYIRDFDFVDWYQMVNWR